MNNDDNGPLLGIVASLHLKTSRYGINITGYCSLSVMSVNTSVVVAHGVIPWILSKNLKHAW